MGYMDISIVGSDTAADLNAKIKQLVKNKQFGKIVTELLKELPQDHGCFNTHGCVNVALVLTKGAAKSLKFKGVLFRCPSLIRNTVTALNSLIEESQKGNWHDLKSKNEHLQAYRTLRTNLLKKLTSKK